MQLIKWILSLAFISIFTAGYTQQASIEKALFELPDLIFTPIETPDGYEGAYELKIKQPIDHGDPSKGHFYQRAYLSHRGFDRPTVLVTEGYFRPANRMYELSLLLEANQIDIEHRYYGQSVPDSMDYTYLNLEQATADYHRIRQLFKEIYQNKWVSTGISKGGQTTIFYRYFYPDDVDVSVPYVAPLNLALEETRIYEFLDTVGSKACRKGIYDVQVTILKNREEAMERLRWFAKGAGLEFTYLTFEEAFEYAVLEYPFSFWQWGADCADLPGKDATLNEVLDHFVAVSDIGFFSDRDMERFSSHYYQAGDEMGYYSYDTKAFKKYLKALPLQSNPSAVFPPDKMTLEYDGTLAAKVHAWVQAHGDHFIYINGDADTWSATAVRPSAEVNSVWFFMPNTDHRQARIRNMRKADQEKLISTLENWLDLELENIWQN